jgi:hypothetical protein
MSLRRYACRRDGNEPGLVLRQGLLHSARTRHHDTISEDRKNGGNPPSDEQPDNDLPESTGGNPPIFHAVPLPAEEAARVKRVALAKNLACARLLLAELARHGRSSQQMGQELTSGRCRPEVPLQRAPASPSANARPRCALIGKLPRGKRGPKGFSESDFRQFVDTSGIEERTARNWQSLAETNRSDAASFVETAGISRDTAERLLEAAA